MKKILVTGASGFVGAAIVERLIKEHRVLSLAGKSRVQFEKSIKNIRAADIADLAKLREVFEREAADVVVHGAGLAHQFGKVRREDFWRVNVSGTENVCRLAKGLGARHFILLSSVSVYGRAAGEIFETTDCRPEGFYAESKLEAEKRAIGFCRENNIRLTILRLATVIGENERGNTARLITLISRGRFFWIGTGENRKSLIYKGDVAEAVFRIIEMASGEPEEAEIFNVTAEPLTMKEVVDAICRSLNKKPPKWKLPENIVRPVFNLNNRAFRLKAIEKAEKIFEKWLSNDVFSGRKLYEKYDFRPSTGIADALGRQVRHYLKQKK